jgi:type IV secretory pathway TraG/TraD family ATPase VirD4
MKSIHSNPKYNEPLKIGDFELTPLDMFEHIVAFGATGSGKTRACVLPVVESVLRRFGNDQQERAALILLDAKGDMGELAGECIRRSGRRDKVLVLGDGGNCWLPIFEQFKGDATAVANFLFETLEDQLASRGGGDNDSFWYENARRLLRGAALMAKAKYGIELGGLQGLTDSLNLILSVNKSSSDDDESQETPAEIKEAIAEGHRHGRIDRLERKDLEAYLRNDVATGNKRTWATIANMGRNYVAQFSQRHLSALFEEGPGLEKLSPEALIDEGRLLIISMSPVLYGEAATPFRIAVKKLFCERILQRAHLVTDNTEERHINQVRPILYVMDEFHTTMTPGGRSNDIYFLDRAREMRCMCLLASQGISAVASVMLNYSRVEHLLNNCRTKFFFANDCPTTADYFQRAAGEAERKVPSVQLQPLPAPAIFRLPNHDFSKRASYVLTQAVIENQRESRHKPEELRTLPNGTALVVTKGDRIARYTRDLALYASGQAQDRRASRGVRKRSAPLAA